MKNDIARSDPFFVVKAVKEGHFRDIYQAMKKLEKEGFSWSEK